MDETDWPDENDWLESEGLYTMQDVESNYDITWPHWFYPDNGGDLSVDDVGDEFSRMIGKPVNTSILVLIHKPFPFKQPRPKLGIPA